MTTSDRRSRRTETLPAKLGAPDTAEAGHVLINKLRGLPSPSRSKGARDAARGGGTLLGSGTGRSSYREMLRASGQQALLRAQNNEPAAPGQRGAQPSPPGKVVTFQNAAPAPSLLLSGHMAPPGDASVRSTTSAPCLPSNAFGLPYAYASPVATPSNASTTPMVQLPDMSPDTGRYRPDRSPTFCMERVPELMPENSLTDLLSIAMPQAQRMSLDREQIAAHLRAAVPEVYED